jgi:hypothetical protein
MWVGVRLIIEYPCAASPNIKRALFCASVDTRNVCGPIARTRRIWRNSRYIESVFAVGRTIGKRANPNSSLLDSVYCGCLIIIVSVLNKGVARTDNFYRPANLAVIPSVNWV